VTSRVTGPLGAGLAGASHVGWAIVVGCGVAIMVLGLLTTTRAARRTAEETAATFERPPAPAMVAR
jgi:hypothetical protein